MIIYKHIGTNEIVIFKNIKEVLNFLNSDRGEEWWCFTKHDWKIGLEDWTDLDLITIKPTKIERVLYGI